MVEIQIPEKVNKIIHTLQEHGYEAYAVGGCVRDSFLGREPMDWDITTSAMPEETKALFPHTFDTGIEHGTITVLLDHEGFEVTTYRVDGKYEDSRHPKEVIFVRNLQEDLLRRDFTINAMAYNEKEGLVDIFGGMDDLKAGIIRCVGNAQARFSEDALRILRGIRFAAQLGFELEDETREGMRLLAPTLRTISAERIQVELVKTMTSSRPDLLREAWKLGITKEFLPEFDLAMETTQETVHHMYTVGEHILHTLQEVRPDRILRLTMLLHDIGKPYMKTMDADGVAHFKGHPEKSSELANEILHRLKFDNDTIRKVTKLVRYHDHRMPVTPAHVRRAVHEIGEDLFPLYLEVRRADVAAQSMYQHKEKVADIDGVEKLYHEIMERKECVSLKMLAVTGKDLIAAGMKPGKEIGQMLEHFLDLVLEHPELNQKEELLKRIEL